MTFGENHKKVHFNFDCGFYIMGGFAA